jgi:DNA-binding transcriptional regulator LsrR (DeoR family)
MIIAPASAMAKIPSVIAVAYGVSKSAAVRAAIRGGLVHGLGHAYQHGAGLLGSTES